jgi:hypothetical protein
MFYCLNFLDLFSYSVNSLLQTITQTTVFRMTLSNTINSTLLAVSAHSLKSESWTSSEHLESMEQPVSARRIAKPSKVKNQSSKKLAKFSNGEIQVGPTINNRTRFHLSGSFAACERCYAAKIRCTEERPCKGCVKAKCVSRAHS